MLDSMNRWADVNGVYQIYPRSFMDKDDDGYGDILGIVDKLDYLKGSQGSLDVDAIWLSPFYTSPMVDGGYDISDYCEVDPLFGTLADFKHLLDQAHRRRIQVMVDFVPNHTSNLHPWFVDSTSSLKSKHRDWYIWRDGQTDGSAPNNWLCAAGGSAWQYNDITKQYYLHSFLKEQPDLNWDNPEVVTAMTAVVDFWLSKGVDGLRVDAVQFMAKKRSFDDNPPNLAYIEGRDDPYHSQHHNFSGSGRQLKGYLAAVAAVVERYDDRLLFFEFYADNSMASSKDSFRPYLDLYDVNPRVAMPFNFGGMFMDFRADSFRDFIGTAQSFLTDQHVPVYCFGNHDQSRLVSRFGRNQARLIAMMQLTLPGIPVMYYGDELGMGDGDISGELIQDSFEKNSPGRGLGRDPERTPMQWSHQPSAGFSQGKPWLPLPAKLADITVADQQFDDGSFLALYRSILALRSHNIALRRGKYVTDGTNNTQVFSYKRFDTNAEFMISLNFSDHSAICLVDESDWQIVVTTGQAVVRLDKTTLELLPCQGVILKRRIQTGD